MVYYVFATNLLEKVKFLDCVDGNHPKIPLGKDRGKLLGLGIVVLIVFYEDNTT